jgi:20S proteasome subunit beta 7
MHQSDINQDDGYTRTPKEFFNYLRTMMYNRRNKGNFFYLIQIPSFSILILLPVSLFLSLSLSISTGNPLWNQLLVAGVDQVNGESFLGYVDLIGTSYEENFIATGYGAYLAIPLIREKWHADMDEGEARALLEDCLRVLYYRDCKASNRIQIAKATAQGTIVSEPYQISSDWETANYDLRHSAVAAVDGSSW